MPLPAPAAVGLFWSAVLACAIGEVAIVRSVLVPRPTRSRGLAEVVWVILPAITLGVLLLFTWRAVRDRSHPGEQRPGAVTVSAPGRLI
jgi:predicted Abi (CAAX) family protease